VPVNPIPSPNLVSSRRNLSGINRPNSPRQAMWPPHYLVFGKSYSLSRSQCCAKISDLRSSSSLLQSVGLAVFLHEPLIDLEMVLIKYTQVPLLILAPRVSIHAVVRCPQSSTFSRQTRTFSMAGNVTRELASPFVSLSTMPSGFPGHPLCMLLHYLCYRKRLIVPQHSGGGADGSIIIFKDTELQNGANTALDGLVRALESLLSQFRSNNTGVDVSAGDMCGFVHSPAVQF
jgi:hypothetical protein